MSATEYNRFISNVDMPKEPRDDCYLSCLDSLIYIETWMNTGDIEIQEIVDKLQAVIATLDQIASNEEEAATNYAVSNLLSEMLNYQEINYDMPLLEMKKRVHYSVILLDVQIKKTG